MEARWSPGERRVVRVFACAPEVKKDDLATAMPKNLAHLAIFMISILATRGAEACQDGRTWSNAGARVCADMECPYIEHNQFCPVLPILGIR